MKNFIVMLVAKIVAMFTEVNGATFIGLNYTNAKGENANHVLIADASYFNACNTAMETLNSLTEKDFSAIAEKYDVVNSSGTKYSGNVKGKLYLTTGKIPKEGTKAREEVLKSIKTTKTLAEIRDEMVSTILLNRNKETQSLRSKDECEKYEYVTNGIKVHKTTNEVVIFAKAHSKVILVKGVYKDSNKEIETLQKEAISKYCKYVLDAELPNEKFRKFCVNDEQLKRVKVKGTEITIA